MRELVRREFTVDVLVTYWCLARHAYQAHRSGGSVRAEFPVSVPLRNFHPGAATCVRYCNESS